MVFQINKKISNKIFTESRNEIEYIHLMIPQIFKTIIENTLKGHRGYPVNYVYFFLIGVHLK